jgi:hypothetical protein
MQGFLYMPSSLPWTAYLPASFAMLGGVAIEYLTTEHCQATNNRDWPFSKPTGAGWGFIGALMLFPATPVARAPVVRAMRRHKKPLDRGQPPLLP